MRRGFLNQPKSNSKSGHCNVPPAQQLMNPSPSAIPEPPMSSNENVLRSDNDIKKWAHKWGESPQAFYNRRNVTFEDFQGVILADAKIHDLIPKFFDARPLALENAYRISQTAGKGSGMFASRDIPAGAVILAENPVSIYPGVMSLEVSTSREEMFKPLFDRLQGDVRERALSLCNSKPANVCGKEEGIVRTNGFGLELAAPKIANPPATRHSGTFLDLSRCNHR